MVLCLPTLTNRWNAHLQHPVAPAAGVVHLASAAVQADHSSARAHQDCLLIIEILCRHLGRRLWRSCGAGPMLTGPGRKRRRQAPGSCRRTRPGPRQVMLRRTSATSKCGLCAPVLGCRCLCVTAAATIATGWNSPFALLGWCQPLEHQDLPRTMASRTYACADVPAQQAEQ